MPQHWIKAAFIRGGTSKGVFFHAGDLPRDADDRDRIILKVLGSPDQYGRQLDGMGGGISSLSKVMIIGPPTHPDADIDYTFGQVAVDHPVVDYGGNCGNLSSAVGPFAVDEGLIQRPDGDAVLARLHNTNTNKIIHARFPVRNGVAEVAGDFAIAGVSGTGAKIRLDFLSPGGAVTSELLPTGKVFDQVHLHDGRIFRVSCVDASVPVAFVSAEELGLVGTEGPDEIEAGPKVMALLDELRRASGVRMGLARSPTQIPLGIPKIAMVSAPRPFKTLSDDIVQDNAHDVAIRIVSMERVHRAVTLTGAMCLATACQITGTVPNVVARAVDRATNDLRIGNPSGTVTVGAEVSRVGERWTVSSAVVYRTQRRLMQGFVALPDA